MKQVVLKRNVIEIAYFIQINVHIYETEYSLSLNVQLHVSIKHVVRVTVCHML